MEELVYGGKYRHYKNKDYIVTGECRHTETLEELVIYQALYESEDFGKEALWVRPKEMFLGEEEYNGEVVKRFTYLGE